MISGALGKGKSVGLLVGTRGTAVTVFVAGGVDVVVEVWIGSTVFGTTSAVLASWTTSAAAGGVDRRDSRSPTAVPNTSAVNGKRAVGVGRLVGLAVGTKRVGRLGCKGWPRFPSGATGTAVATRVGKGGSELKNEQANKIRLINNKKTTTERHRAMKFDYNNGRSIIPIQLPPISKS